MFMIVVHNELQQFIVPDVETMLRGTSFFSTQTINN